MEWKAIPREYFFFFLFCLFSVYLEVVLLLAKLLSPKKIIEFERSIVESFTPPVS
jgi:hypothetical protein